MPKMKKSRAGKRTRKKSFWRNLLKKREEKPQTGLAVRQVRQRRRTEPDHWTPPFPTKKSPVLKVDQRDMIVIDGPSSFDLGEVSATVDVMFQMRLSHNFQRFIDECLERYKHLDWGDVNENERWLNKRRITAGTGTVCGIYTEHTSEVQIWISTDLGQAITRISISGER